MEQVSRVYTGCGADSGYEEAHAENATQNIFITQYKMANHFVVQLLGQKHIWFYNFFNFSDSYFKVDNVVKALKNVDKFLCDIFYSKQTLHLLH